MAGYRVRIVTVVNQSQVSASCWLEKPKGRIFILAQRLISTGVTHNIMNDAIAKGNLTVRESWQMHDDMPGTNETRLIRSDNNIEAMNQNGDTQAEKLDTIQIEVSDLKDENPSGKNQEDNGNEKAFTRLLRSHGVVVVTVGSARGEMGKV
jgi:hypothetical protein